MKNLLVFTILTFIITSCNIKQDRIFVSPDGNDQNSGSKAQPLRSPAAAKQRVAELISDNTDRDIIVVFREGTYELSETLVFNPEDGGNEGRIVSYAAYKDEDVIFSGGKELSNWAVRDDGLWETKIDESIEIEQLYVNGNRATRARTPNVDARQARWYIDSVDSGYDKESQVFDHLNLKLVDNGALKKLNPSGEFEIIIFKDWATLRKQVSEVNFETNYLSLKPPLVFFDGNYNGILAPYANRFTCFLEGDKSFIDQVGEWAVDKENNTITYFPHPEQKLESFKAVIPLRKTLVHLSGNENRRIQNLHFENIKFHFAAYVLPDFGHDGRQACFFYSKGTSIQGDKALIEEAVRSEWATNCSFTSCEVAHTGANGVYITTGSNNIRIDKSCFYDIGGNGVMIGTASDPKEDIESLVNSVFLQNSSVHTAGQHYQSAVGIWQGFATDCTISGNEVFDLPYTGISIGWQWNPLPTSSENNLIADNHIYNVMKMLGDGGGIYTLGFQPGSIIRDNVIHDIHRSELNHASPNNGMFIDEGSKGYVVSGNHIYNIIHTCIRGHRAAGVELLNNKFVPGEFPAISHTPPYGAMIFANKDSTIVWPNPGWPDEWGYPEEITAFTMSGNTFDEVSND